MRSVDTTFTLPLLIAKLCSESLILNYSKSLAALTTDTYSEKLRTLGINETASNWFWGYLSDRKHLAEIQYTKDNAMQRSQSTH